MATAPVLHHETRPARLWRSFDAERVNFIVNHPTVRPWCGGDPEVPLDMSGAVTNLKNYTLLGKHGGFLFVWTAPATYEVHVFIMPLGRGKAAYQLARDAKAYMIGIGAEHLWARIAPGAENVRHLTVSNGFRRCGTDVLDVGTGPVTYDLYNWRTECRPS